MSDFAVQQIDHVELFVPDPREAAAWYARVFGLRPLSEFAHWADGGPLMLGTRSAQTKLALFQGEPSPADAHAAFRRVAFRVGADSFAAFVARLPELGLESESGHAIRAEDHVDHGKAISIYFVDPWHHRFEITTYEVDRLRELLP